MYRALIGSHNKASNSVTAADYQYFGRSL